MNMQYTNPVSYSGPTPTNPDPYVLRYIGTYYCYSTDESGVRVSTSPDLVTWRDEGLCFQESGSRAYWAPCVVYRNGIFYLYVSTRPADIDDPHFQRMRVATSDDPLGPFRFERVMADTFCIDADVVIDEQGDAFMFYATNDAVGASTGRAGTCVVLDRMNDMMHLAGAPRPVIVPTLDEEIFAENRFGDGRNWHTIEGSTYVTYRDRAYMTYSGNAYVREDYFVGVTSADLVAPIDALRWTKQPDDSTYAPILRRSADVEGTGHNSITFAPNLVDPWIVYHGRSAHEPLTPGVEQRVMRIDPLEFANGRLECDGPSSTARPAPALPDIRIDGIRRTDSVARAVIPLADGIGPYRAEIDLRVPHSDMGAVFGLEVMRTADESWTVWINVAMNTVRVDHEVGGILIRGEEEALSGIDLRCWQALTIDRRLGDLQVRCGRQTIANFAHTGGLTPASVSLVSQYTQLELGFAALTEYIDWDPAQGAAIARLMKALGCGGENDGDGNSPSRGAQGIELHESGLRVSGSAFLAIASSMRQWRLALDLVVMGTESHARIWAGGHQIAGTPPGATGAQHLDVRMAGDDAPLGLDLSGVVISGLALTSIRGSEKA